MSNMTLVSIIFIYLLCQSEATSMWDQRFPDPTSGTIYSGSYGEDQFLVVGEEGLMMSSPTGYDWSVCSSPLNGNYKSSFFSNDGFHIESDAKYGTMATSGSSDFCTNTGSWHETNSQLSSEVTNVRIAPAPVPAGWNSGFVSIAAKKLYFAQEAADVNLVTGIDFTQYQALAVHFANAFWMAKLAGPKTGTNSYEIFISTSSDGLTWSTPINTTLTSGPDYSLSYCETYWISAFDGGIGGSNDNGLTWTITQPLTNVFFSSLLCSGYRCVGSTGIEIWETSTCAVGYQAVALPGSPGIGPQFPVMSLNGTFVVAGDGGAIFYSDSAKKWISVGTPYASSNELNLCSQIIAGNGNFFVACYKSVLVSSDGVNWKYRPYALKDIANEVFVDIQYSTTENILVGLSNQNNIYTSTDNATSWQGQLTLQLDSHNDFEMSTLAFSNANMLQAFGQEVLADNSLIPIIAVAKTYKSWNIYVPNVWIKQMGVYNNDFYIGVGKGGIYMSNNMYQWDVVFSVKGQCIRLSTNNAGDQWIVLCENEQSDLSIDQVIVVSTNGKQWTSYSSPCANSALLPPTQLDICDYLDYIPAFNKFVLGTKSETGSLYGSADGQNWSLIICPYAVSYIGMVANSADLSTAVMATLTEKTILSGPAGSVAFASNIITTQPYNVTGNSQYNPNYQGVGLLGTVSIITQSQSSEDGSSDLNGGQITGIVFGTLIALAILVVVILVLLLAGYIIRIRMHRGKFESRSILTENEENDML